MNLVLPVREANDDYPDMWTSIIALSNPCEGNAPEFISCTSVGIATQCDKNHI